MVVKMGVNNIDFLTWYMHDGMSLTTMGYSWKLINI